MDIEKIREIGLKKNVVKLNLFVAFLSKRFPNENDMVTSYFNEWADRFNTGNPEKYMDNMSLSIYDELIGGEPK